jgi:hypothetical protein
MQIIKYKATGNIMINAGKAGMIQGDTPLIQAISALLEKEGTNHHPVQTNKNGDAILMFEHELDKVR